MKKIFILIMLFTISISAQSWNSIITSSINVTNVKYIENYADKDGIHIVTFDSGDDIKYYLLNTSGSTIRSATISTNGEYPNIVGDNEAVYIVYREGSNIRVKKSTNAGASWSQRTEQSIGSNQCSGIDAAISDDGIHVVWSIADSYGWMETNYKRFDDGNNNWNDFKNVTDYTDGYGTSPTVAISTDRVHVGYNSLEYMPDTYYTFDADEMSRTKYNSTWQTQQTIASHQSGRGKIFAASNKLYDFYYDFVPGMGSFYTLLYFKYRNYGSTAWSSSTLLDYIDPTVNSTVCETANGNVHVYFANGVVEEKIIINGSVNSTSAISAYNSIYALSAKSIHNDIYLNWCENNSTYLKLRQYDAAPSTPQNLSITSYNSHPKLVWNKNIDADIDYYRIYKKKGTTNFVLYATSTTAEYVDNEEIYLSSPHAFDGIAKYKIMAIDLSGYESSFSNEVEVRVAGEPLEKGSVTNHPDEFKNYELAQNFPNPFNPTTSIKYSVKERGFVSLKVYDLLGKEVADLVNETKNIGHYSANFDASELPSGVYIYSLRVNDFVQNRKMSLLK
ncbi:MAG: T9SS type A sorting domain-containing protein [Ignavibacteriae bacterium]|nr:T9SS C-terminal target domain-containing protein [Ignavibacteriota bacterium]NOG97696.1 T9SS type A sorting domain-containing protein [Ignavibacteriota bacterium]